MIFKKIIAGVALASSLLLWKNSMAWTMQAEYYDEDAEHWVGTLLNETPVVNEALSEVLLHYFAQNYGLIYILDDNGVTTIAQYRPNTF